MRSRWFPRLALLLGFVLLGGSLAANVYLGRQANAYYRQLHEVRLDPLGLRIYAADRAQPPADTGALLMVFYGDSRAAMWPAPAGAGLEAVRFINRGVGNQTTAQVVGRFDIEVAPLTPDIVVIQAGINDLKTIPLFPEQAHSIAAEALANLQALVGQAQAGGAQVIITTIFPVGPVPLVRRPFWSDAVPAGVLAVNAGIMDLAGEGVTVLDAYALLAEGEAMRADYALDTLHVTPAGYAVLNEALARLLREELTQDE